MRKLISLELEKIAAGYHDGETPHDDYSKQIANFFNNAGKPRGILWSEINPSDKDTFSDFEPIKRKTSRRSKRAK